MLEMDDYKRGERPLEEKKEKESSLKRRSDDVENFLGKGVGTSSKITWGVLLLSGFGIYALIRLVLIIIEIF